MTDRIAIGDLKVAAGLAAFAEDEALPGTDVTPEAFWAGLDRLVHAMGPKNRALLAKRDRLQAEIDAWHRARRGQPLYFRGHYISGDTIPNSSAAGPRGRGPACAAATFLAVSGRWNYSASQSIWRRLTLFKTIFSLAEIIRAARGSMKARAEARALVWRKAGDYTDIPSLALICSGVVSG